MAHTDRRNSPKNSWEKEEYAKMHYLNGVSIRHSIEMALSLSPRRFPGTYSRTHAHARIPTSRECQQKPTHVLRVRLQNVDGFFHTLPFVVHACLCRSHICLPREKKVAKIDGTLCSCCCCWNWTQYNTSHEQIENISRLLLALRRLPHSLLQPRHGARYQFHYPWWKYTHGVRIEHRAYVERVCRVCASVGAYF